jgi:triosephosphate isomerase
MLVVGNWKMNKTIKETRDFFLEFNSLVKKSPNQIVICPSFPCLAEAKKLASRNIFIGAQNVFFEEKGEFTGEVSVQQLKGLCDFVIVGHSDRRHKFNESDQLINRKVNKALEFGFNVILCVGETLKERSKGKTDVVLEQQLKNALSGTNFSEKLFVAYEPVWAIGTGRNAKKEDIQNAFSFIASKLTGLFGKKANKTKILYGGSVKPENLNEIFSVGLVNGVLVGKASLDAKAFARIANYKKKHPNC